MQKEMCIKLGFWEKVPLSFDWSVLLIQEMKLYVRDKIFGDDKWWSISGIKKKSKDKLDVVLIFEKQ